MSSNSSNTKAVAALAEELKQKGMTTFKEEFPAKIALLTSLLQNELLRLENDAVLPPESEVTPVIPPISSGEEKGETSAAGGRRKKRKMTETQQAAASVIPAAHVDAPSHSDSEEESEDEIGHLNGRHGHAHWDYTHDFAVPCNKTIMKVIELLRKEWKEAVELVGCVKLWIQLSIPPIESGGQFHVGVQEEVIQELNRFEDVAYNYLESPTKYFQTRAKLGAKLSRHRSVYDYRQSLLEADSLEYLNLKMAATELRNSYLVAYDLLSKNEDKLSIKDQSFGSRMTI
ncbi:hypothetical protein NSK_001127 [Nannochloropsis salina CCMP1776]|uniref:Proteasome activator PA28 C-terminal domain-containing protein n=1 Tax=Nannochloropsis salina CCMP1776 TaxID=1027361 RepID=A0A4D9DG46_9STRA|nr:hypothetical protein NSK_001127 [Nannochloropsis salina CCMP1776]|eukprot:TFJ87778.1 hypothetical protein NSK_001127 [Nannochloropsis salina CCMP1776]